jgi:ubiquinone/menaquinone biosynthesis C-methylase UbiE
VNVFEKKYIEDGLNSQRKYPNEQLISFLAENYFCLTPSQRGEIKFLELGCGSGANLWMVAREGFDAHGIDFSKTGIEYCHGMLKNWGTNATLKVADMQNLPYENNTFDIIADIVSMQHLTYEQHLNTWKESYRCLSDNGRFFSYHLGESSLVYPQGLVKYIDHCTIDNIPDGHPLCDNGQTCFLSRNEVVNELQKIGFKNVSVDKARRTYENQLKFIEYLVITAQK